MTEYQEKQWNIFICNVSFSLFIITWACSRSLPLILFSLHTVWSKSEHCSSSSCFFEIIRCPLVVVMSFWPLAVLISAITLQRCLGKCMLLLPLSQQSRKLFLVKLNLNYPGLCKKMIKSFSDYSSLIFLAGYCNDDLAYAQHLKVNYPIIVLYFRSVSLINKLSKWGTMIFAAWSRGLTKIWSSFCQWFKFMQFFFVMSKSNGTVKFH